jgi:beta-galactosidase
MPSQLFTLGAAYYPDYLPELSLCRTALGEIKQAHWPERIKIDFERMRRCHIASIRMGEFSWASVESARDNFDFSRFEFALDQAALAGLEVIFCTPTATPPKWLIDETPDILPITRSGYTIPFGTRRHYDVNNETYRTEAKRITRAYAQALGNHEAIVGWQTDNELGCHESVYLFTEAAKRAFRKWLRTKFSGNIDKLNEDWFCAFWSQRYSDFDQIELPFDSWADQNPHMELDFRRFSNAQYAMFQKDQVEILKELSPGRFVTHNFMTLFTDLCPWTMSADLDEIGFDHYQMDVQPHPITSFWQFALMRSLKRKRFMVLEQQPLQVNWHQINQRFKYSWLFLWTLQSAFLGARSMHYFSWQRFQGGAEQYHDGIVSHDVRVPQTWQERALISIAQVFRQLSDRFGLTTIALPKRDVVCVFDSESLWSHQITSQSKIYSTRRELDLISSMCASSGLGLWFADSIAKALQADEQPRLLVLPGYAFEFTDEEKAALKAFIEAGGRVLSLPRTAMKQRNNQMSQTPMTFLDPSDFYLEDYGALLQSERDTFATASAQFEGELWAEKIRLVGNWDVLAKFTAGPYRGSPAIIRRRIGRGQYIHMCTCAPSSHDFFRWLLTELGIESLAPQMTELQLIPIEDGDRRLLAAFNFTETTHSFETSYQSNGFSFSLGDGQELQCDEIVDRKEITLAPHACAFIELSRVNSSVLNPSPATSAYTL